MRSYVPGSSMANALRVGFMPLVICGALLEQA